MAKTLANLTLQLSREIERLETRCGVDLSKADRERDRVLLAMGQAKQILQRYHKAIDDAKQKQLHTLQEADLAREKEVVAAEEKRRNDLLKRERSYVAARKKATVKRRNAIATARKKWKEALAKATSRPLPDQRQLRKTADLALQKAIEAASAEFQQTVEDARLAHQAALQDDLVNERIAVERAHRKAQRIITGAAVTYERDVAREEGRLRNSLTAHPEARRAQERHDEKLWRIRDTCEQAKDELFRQFSQSRRRMAG